MNVLLVDDQKAIVDNLKKGIRWEQLSVEQVYTACSAQEAKLILMNFVVDVLISDIEMPEEDGLSLCSWAMSRFEDLECIFLTAHEDFAYAKRALKLGSFDYILQPARYEEVEKSLLKVRDKIQKKHKVHQIMDVQKMALEQKNIILDVMISKAVQKKEEEVNLIFTQFYDMFRVEYNACAVFPMLIQIVKWKRLTNIWEEGLVRTVFCNVLEELFLDQRGKTGVSYQGEDRYWIFLACEEGRINEEIFKNNLQIFCRFIEENMDFLIAVYPSKSVCENDFCSVFNSLTRRADHGRKSQGILWNDTETEEDQDKDDPIEQAVLYIKRNLNKNFSRADVAGHVHLNEEYFSRLFSATTGITFKNYVLMEKTEEAKRLLANSRLSVGIIASKTGFDNFSHFSKMFKKMTNLTPQEYRKEHQQEI
ncbi:MAG: helix-turn-helix domain-containing protein [Lachnospiraceae bacterium]|nr:helix-turn-helix domain-containing protein [Lachnospiraceae bacterium]